MTRYEDVTAVECWDGPEGRVCKILTSDDVPEDPTDAVQVDGSVHMTNPQHVESLHSGTDLYHFDGTECHVDMEGPRELICGDEDP
jgi:hypothetical protein